MLLLLLLVLSLQENIYSVQNLLQLLLIILKPKPKLSQRPIRRNGKTFKSQ